MELFWERNSSLLWYRYRGRDNMLPALLYNGKTRCDWAFHFLFRLKKVPNAENIVWVSFPRLRRNRLVLVHIIRGSDGVNWFWFMLSEGRTEQTSFSSCHPRVGRSKLILVHVIRGSDRANWFWFILSEVRTEQTDFDSYYPRFGQSKWVLVCFVDWVDSLNGFRFVPSTGLPVSMSFGLLRRPSRAF